ncbi:hypothetical protein MRB53_012852 [Persea americana]|uniref:Uncharacterized protein n=1 Tax=Persea americana TaxID=3435 RepID=A0ACC2LYU3_PERAE|nr:hypothetical protein MRB53_012852 [Persea americana]
MKIGRPVERSWDRIEFAFPLCLMWHERLKGFNLLSKTISVREQLDKQEDKDNPYIQYGDRLLEHFEDEEKALFGSQTVLIFFGVFENHNAYRVMKQFGLRQTVPPTWKPPLLREERASTTAGDYQIRRKEINYMWEERWNNIIDGEPDDTAHHSDEYLAWYKGITHLRIGRGTGAIDASRNVVEEQSVAKVMSFFGSKVIRMLKPKVIYGFGSVGGLVGEESQWDLLINFCEGAVNNWD